MSNDMSYYGKVQALTYPDSLSLCHFKNKKIKLKSFIYREFKNYNFISQSDFYGTHYINILGLLLKHFQFG